jgi:hypothetical protein
MIGRSYFFHVDRVYMSDIGCLARVCCMGRTLEIWRSGDVGETQSSLRGYVAAFLLGVVVVPSPLYSAKTVAALERFIGFAF